jgi:hypothetical protein
MYRVLKRARMCGKLKAFLGDKNQSKTTVLMKDFSTKVFFIYTRESGKALAYFDESISLAQTHTLSLVPSLSLLLVL